MIVIRLLAAVSLLVIGAALMAFVWTRDTRWLRFAAQVFKLSLVLGVVIGLLYFLERLL